MVTNHTFVFKYVAAQIEKYDLTSFKVPTQLYIKFVSTHHTPKHTPNIFLIPRKLTPMLVTFEVFHLDMSLLKELASQNIDCTLFKKTKQQHGMVRNHTFIFKCRSTN